MDKRTKELIIDFALMGYRQGYMDATSILMDTKPDIEKMKAMLEEKFKQTEPTNDQPR